MDMSQAPPPGYDEDACRGLLGFVGFTEEDAALLATMATWLGPQLDEVVSAFYDYLTGAQATRGAFRDAAQIAHLREVQKNYLLTAMTGPHDAAYFRSRWHVGDVHHRVGIEPQWFIGAYQLHHRLLFPRIVAHFPGELPAALAHVQALDKILAVDMAVALDSYWANYNAAVQNMRAMNAEIRAASEAKSQFLANMSHEFRTPLNAILGFAEVLQDQLAGPLNGEQLEYLQDIHQAGQVLLRLINDVLDLAKVEAGRLELFHETFPIAQAIREALTIVRGTAEKKRLYLRSNLPPELGLITADQLRFKQVLYNLLSNAVKFTDSGGVAVSAQVEGEQLHLIVEDTGMGIREEDRARIFREFSQLDASHTRRHEGTGLGLALTRRLLEAHGGRIELESEPGRGSAFHVFLPLRPPAAPS